MKPFLPDPWPDNVVSILGATLGPCEDCCTARTGGDLCEKCHEAFDRVDFVIRSTVEKSAADLAEARKTIKRLNRRCQEAEAALPEWKVVVAGTWKGGSFGRALLAYSIKQAWEENKEAQRLLSVAIPVLKDLGACEDCGCGAWKLLRDIRTFLSGPGSAQEER